MELTEKQQTKYEKLIEGKDLTDTQKYHILLGVGFGVNAKLYAKPYFSWEQMLQIRLGLEFGVDAKSYAKKNLSAEEMEEKRLYLMKNR